MAAHIHPPRALAERVGVAAVAGGVVRIEPGGQHVVVLIHQSRHLRVVRQGARHLIHIQLRGVAGGLPFAFAGDLGGIGGRRGLLRRGNRIGNGAIGQGAQRRTILGTGHHIGGDALELGSGGGGIGQDAALDVIRPGQCHGGGRRADKRGERGRGKNVGTTLGGPCRLTQCAAGLGSHLVETLDNRLIQPEDGTVGLRHLCHAHRLGAVRTSCRSRTGNGMCGYTGASYWPPDGLHASYLNCSLPDSWRLTMETSCRHGCLPYNKPRPNPSPHRHTSPETTPAHRGKTVAIAAFAPFRHGPAAMCRPL